MMVFYGFTEDVGLMGGSVVCVSTVLGLVLLVCRHIC